MGIHILLPAMAFVLYVWFTYLDKILARFNKIGDAGAYGEIFGAINALLTSLAFRLCWILFL
jgi:hypothetical protein